MLLADVGTLEPASVEADLTREEVGAAADVDVEALREAGDRGAAIAGMASAAAAWHAGSTTTVASTAS